MGKMNRRFYSPSSHFFFYLKYIIETVTGTFVSRRVGHAKWPWLLSLAFVMLPAAFPFVSAKKTVCCVKKA